MDETGKERGFTSCCKVDSMESFCFNYAFFKKIVVSLNIGSRD